MIEGWRLLEFKGTDLRMESVPLYFVFVLPPQNDLPPVHEDGTKEKNRSSSAPHTIKNRVAYSLTTRNLTSSRQRTAI